MYAQQQPADIAGVRDAIRRTLGRLHPYNSRAARFLRPLNKVTEECEIELGLVRLFTLTQLGYAIRAIVTSQVSW